MNTPTIAEQLADLQRQIDAINARLGKPHSLPLTTDEALLRKRAYNTARQARYRANKKRAPATPL